MEHNYPRMYLCNEAVRNRAIEAIRQLPINENDPLVIEIKVKTRSMEQNDKFHAMLGDISKQALWQGDHYDLYGWKNLLVSGHAIATKLPYKLVMGIEGELVNVREQTSKMGVRRMASLIEYVTVWGIENGVKFNCPNCGSECADHRENDDWGWFSEEEVIKNGQSTQRSKA